MAIDDPEKRARTTARIAAVRDRFTAALPERTAALATLALACGADDAGARKAALDELRLGLHNLAGAAPTLGLAALGKRAAEIEARVIAARTSGAPLPGEVAETLARDVKALADG